MSDDKNLGDDLDDMLDDAKKGARDFSESAKQSARDFSAGAKDAFNTTPGENKKILAGVLAILLGSLGVHKFILGYNKEGIILLVVTLVLGAITCGIGASLAGIVGIIEGIVYLTKSDAEFYATYQVGKKPWF